MSLTSGLGSISPRHVVRGVGRGWVYYFDPAAGEAKARAADFEAAWHDADRLNAVFRSWGVVAYPR